MQRLQGSGWRSWRADPWGKNFVKGSPKEEGGGVSARRQPQKCRAWTLGEAALVEGNQEGVLINRKIPVGWELCSHSLLRCSGYLVREGHVRIVGLDLIVMA